MKCSRCGEKTCVVTINSKHEKLCDKCYEGDKPHPHKIDGEKVENVVD